MDIPFQYLQRLVASDRRRLHRVQALLEKAERGFMPGGRGRICVWRDSSGEGHFSPWSQAGIDLFKVP